MTIWGPGTGSINKKEDNTIGWGPGKVSQDGLSKKQGNLLLSAPKVENGKLTVDKDIVAQSKGFVNAMDEANYKAKNPDLYGASGGIKIIKPGTNMDMIGSPLKAAATYDSNYAANLSSATVNKAIDDYKNVDTKEINNIISTVNTSEWLDSDTIKDYNDKISKYVNSQLILNELGYFNSISEDERNLYFDTLKQIKNDVENRKNLYTTFKSINEYNAYILNHSAELEGGMSNEMIAVRLKTYENNIERIKAIDAEIAKIPESERKIRKSKVTDSGNFVYYYVNSDTYQSLLDEKSALEEQIRLYERYDLERDKNMSSVYDIDSYAQFDYEEYLRNPDGYILADSIKNVLPDGLGNRHLNPTKNTDKTNAYDPYASAQEQIRHGENIDPLTQYMLYREKSNGSYVPNADSSTAVAAGIDGNWEYINEDEKKYYYYLTAKGECTKALYFLNGLRNVLYRREEIAKKEAAQDLSGWDLVVDNIVSVPKQIAGGTLAFFDDVDAWFRGAEIDPYSPGHQIQTEVQITRSETADRIDDATGGGEFLGVSWGDVYQAAMSGFDSIAGAAMFGSGYTVIMGMGAASSKAKQLYEQGASNGQIAAASLLSGVAEMVFEKFSIDHFLSEFVNAPTKKWYKLLGQTALQGGIEMTEEMATELSNIFTDALVLGSRSEWKKLIASYKQQGYSDTDAIINAMWDKGGDILEAGICGFISGGTMGDVGAITNYAANKIINSNNAILTYGFSAESVYALVDNGLAMPKNSDAYKLAVKSEAKLKSGKSLSGTALYNLATAIEGEIETKSVSRLKELGVDKKTTKELAPVVARAVFGEQLTSQEHEMIKNNMTATKVVNELSADRANTVWKDAIKNSRSKNVADSNSINNQGEVLQSTAKGVVYGDAAAEVGSVHSTERNEKTILHSESNDNIINTIDDDYVGVNIKDVGKTNQVDDLINKSGDSQKINNEFYENKDLNESELTAVLNYKSSESYRINDRLRNFENLSDVEIELVKNIDNALIKMPTYQGIVYRNISFDWFGGQEAYDAFLNEHKLHDFVTYLAYTSASTKVDGYLVDGHFAVSMVIESRNAKNVEGYGNNFESEVIFPRNSVFLVNNVEYSDKGQPIIYMTEVIDNDEGKHGQFYSKERSEAVQSLQKSISWKRKSKLQDISDDNTTRRLDRKNYLQRVSGNERGLNYFDYTITEKLRENFEDKVELRFLELGVDKKTTKELAPVVARAVFGEQLTSQEHEMIKNNMTATKVVNELSADRANTVWKDAIKNSRINNTTDSNSINNQGEVLQSTAESVADSSNADIAKQDGQAVVLKVMGSVQNNPDKAAPGVVEGLDGRQYFDDGSGYIRPKSTATNYKLNNISKTDYDKFFFKKPIKASKKDWAKVNSARTQKYSQYTEDIPDIDFFRIAEYNEINIAYRYYVRNYDKYSFEIVSKIKIKEEHNDVKTTYTNINADGLRRGVDIGSGGFAEYGQAISSDDKLVELSEESNERRIVDNGDSDSRRRIDNNDMKEATLSDGVAFSVAIKDEIETESVTRLKELGVDKKTTKELAPVVAKAVFGEQLTSQEHETLKNNETATQVVNELSADKANTVWKDTVKNSRIINATDSNSVTNQGEGLQSTAKGFVDSANDFNYNDNSIKEGEYSGIYQGQGLGSSDEETSRSVDSRKEAGVGEIYEETTLAFRRRTKEIYGRNGRTVSHLNIAVAYKEANVINKNSPAGIAYNILKSKGYNVVFCDGPILINNSKYTVERNQAITISDGTIYISSDSTFNGESIALHEVVHVWQYGSNAEYLNYESVVLQEIDPTCRVYKKAASQINDNHYNGKYDVEDISSFEYIIRELTAYISQYVCTNPKFAREKFGGMFENWDNVVQAVYNMNNKLGFGDIIRKATSSDEVAFLNSKEKQNDVDEFIRGLHGEDISSSAEENTNLQSTANGVVGGDADANDTSSTASGPPSPQGEDKNGLPRDNIAHNAVAGVVRGADGKQYFDDGSGDEYFGDVAGNDVAHGGDGSVKEGAATSSNFDLTEPAQKDIARAPTAEEAVKEAITGKQKTNIQRHITDICKKLDSNVEVEFVDGLETNGKFIRSQNKILIRSDLSAVQMYVEVFKHEFMHRLETKQLYSKFFNFCFKKSKAFEQYVRTELKAAGVDVDAVTRDGVIDDYTNYKYDQYKNSKEIPEKDRDAFTKENAQQEIIADFFAQILFQGKQYRSRIIEALQNADGEALIGIGDEVSSEAALLELQQKEPTLFEKVLEWFRDVINRLRGLQQAKSLVEQLDNEINLLESMARRVYQSKDSKRLMSKRFGEVKFDLSYNEAIEKLNNDNFDKKNNTHVMLLENTPPIYIDKAGAKDLKIIAGWDVIYLALRKSGNIPGNYHNLGIEVMKKVPEAIKKPLYIIKQNNGRIIAITEIVVKGNRSAIISIELDTFKSTTQDGKNKSENYNLIVAFIDAKPNYLQNTIFAGDIVYNKNNESPTNFILRLKSLKKALSNDDLVELSDNIISQPKEKVNTEKSNDTPSGKYSLGSPMQQMRYSPEDIVVEKYTESQYNNFGWVRYNNVLSVKEYNTLLSRYADYKHNKNKYPTTRFGEAVIHSSECPDVLMYVKGKIDNPQITKIVRIDIDEYNASVIKEEILHYEYRQIPIPYKDVETVYGEGILDINKKQDFISFQGYKAEQERRIGEEDNNNYRAEQDGRGSAGENTRVSGADSLSESAFSISSPIQSVKYSEFNLKEPNINDIEISEETKFLAGLSGKNLNKTQLHIVDICKKLDSNVEVEFVDGLKTNGKFIRSQNKILIRSDLNAVQMYVEVLKHEFMHRLETKQLYSKFFNFCFKKSKAFEQYVRAELKSAGVDVDAVTREGVIDAYTNYKYDQYKNSKDIPPKDRDAFTKENAQQEIIADFFAQILFQGKQYRSRIIEALQNADGEALIGIGDEVSSEAALMELYKQEPTLFEQVLNWLKDVINRLRGLPQAKSLVEQLDNELNKLESMARRAYQSKDSKRLMKKKSADEKYSFEGYEDDGKGKYKSNFPKGTPKSAKGERVLNYIQKVWSKKPIRLKITEGNNTRYIIAKFDPSYDESGNLQSDASKLMGGNRHGTSAEQRVTLDLADDYYQIASESTYNYSKKETGKDNPTHKDVKIWHYFVNDIYFAEYDSDEYIPYRVSINIKERADGEYFYSFSAEKQRESDTPRTLHAAVNVDKNTNANVKLSNNKLSQKSQFVNNEGNLSLFEFIEPDIKGVEISEETKFLAGLIGENLNKTQLHIVDICKKLDSNVEVEFVDGLETNGKFIRSQNKILIRSDLSAVQMYVEVFKHEFMHKNEFVSLQDNMHEKISMSQITSDNINIDKYGYNQDNISKANKQGDFLNEFYEALNKTEWAQFYNAIAKEGYLATTQIDTIAPIVIKDKLVIANRMHTSKNKHDYIVRDVFKIVDFNNDNYSLTLIKEAIEKGEIYYDKRTINQTLSKFLKRALSSELLARYNGNSKQYVIGSAERKYDTDTIEIYRDSEERVARERLSLRDKSSVQGSDELLSEEVQSLNNYIEKTHNKFFNYCFNKSEVFEQYVRIELKAAGVDVDAVTRDGVIDDYTNYKYDQYKNSKEIPEKDRDAFTKENAQQEIIADFFAQILFQGKQYRSRIIEALQNADGEALIGIGDEVSSEAALMELQQKEPTLFEQVLEWFRDVINRLRGLPQAKSLVEQLDNELNLLESMARRVYQSKDSKRLVKEKQNNIKYSIKKSIDGQYYVEVENNTIAEKNDGKNIAKILSDIVKIKFKDFINVSGQKIGLNGKTVREWQYSKDAQYLLANSKQVYIDKLNAFNNADELLKIAKNYVGEAIKHERKDNFVEFARGTVDFKVSNRGYSADVIVGTTKSNVTLLYDIVGLQKKVIEEASHTAQDRRAETTSINDIISTSNEFVNNEDSKRLVKKRFSEVRYSTQKSFAEQVDEVLDGEFDRTNAVYVGMTPQILQDVGLNGDLPMLTTASHIRNANKPKNTKKHHHGLTETQIKNIPEKIAHPVMIMDSLDATRNSIVVVTDMLDVDKSPIVVSIKTDGKGMYNNVEIDSNFLTGYYGRDGFANFIENNVAADTFLYINKEKATTLLTESSTSWLEQLKNYDFDVIIRKTRANVKENTVKNSDRDTLESRHKELQNEYSQLEKEIEVLKKSEEYNYFVEALSTLEKGEELDNAIRDYGRWTRESGLYSKSKRMSEIIGEQKDIRAAIEDDHKMSRDAYMKSIENLTKDEKMDFVNKDRAIFSMPIGRRDNLNKQTTSVENFGYQRYNDFDTYFGENLYDTPKNLKPSTEQEWHAFCRSFANKTTNISQGDFKIIIIFTADNYYIINADGYMSGTVLFKNNIDEYNEKEQVFDDDTSTNIFAAYDERTWNRERNSDYDGDTFAGGIPDTFNVELDEFIAKHPEWFANRKESYADYKRRLEATSSDEVAFSMPRDYSYGALIDKPDMEITVVDNFNGQISSDARKDIIDKAVENAAGIGKINEKGNAVVYVKDIDSEIILSKSGLRHGFDRRFELLAPVVLKSGEILSNSIRINELIPKADNISKSYVLIGVAKNAKNEPYIISFVANKVTNEISEMDVLYTINAKTEPAGSLSPSVPAKTTDYFTDSTISISKLLDYVNKYFPDILPESVLRHYGYESRPEGKIGESALFSMPIGKRKGKKNNVIELSKDNELSKRIGDLRGSAKYKVIQQYILDVLSGEQIVLSDGKVAVVDKRDALHIANKAANKKTAQISAIKEIAQKAVLVAEEESIKERKFDYFYYYQATVKYDGESFNIYLDVGRTKNNGTYHIYDITNKLRDTANRINGLERPKPNEGYALTNGISNNIITKTVNDVNSDYSTNADIFDEALDVKERDYIEQICDNLGRKVVFEDLRNMVYKGEIISPDGYIKDGVIHLNTYAENPLGFVLKHELTHFGEKSSEYKKFVNAVKSSSLYADWIKSKTGKEYIWDAEEAYRQTVYELQSDFKSIDDPKIDNEIIADFVGEMLFTDNGSGMVALSSEIDVKQRNKLIQFVLDFISYLKKKFSGQKHITRELSLLEDSFNRLLSDATQMERNGVYDYGSDVRFSLRIKHTDGTIEGLADARHLTNEQAIEYLNQARRGELRRETYIPIRKDTPVTIIDTLGAVGITVENRSLVMQVRKAQQAMSVTNNGAKSKKHGSNIRSHAMSAEQIVEIVNNLDNPTAVILQTNRYNQYGEELPDNVAVFVEYNNDGSEGVAIVEFESSIDSEFIGTEFGDTNYHTVVTIFEPDTERGGMPFDYVEELLLNPDNYEIEIVRKQPARSAAGEKHPNTSSELLSNNIITKLKKGVNSDYSTETDILGRDNEQTDDNDIKFLLNRKVTSNMINDNINKVVTMDSVADLTGKEFEKGDVDLITQVEQFFDSVGNIAKSKYGNVELTRAGIKASLGHGIGRQKAIAFKAVPNAIMFGEVINYQVNWKNRGYDTAVFAAPITIDGEKYFLAAVVNVEYNKNSYYLHEVALQKAESNTSFKTGTAKNGTPSDALPSIYTLLQKLQVVNSDYLTNTDIFDEALEVKEREYIEQICNKLGREVVFEDLREKVYKGEIISPDGYIKNGVIHLNIYAENPLGFVLKHELTHFGEIAQQKYREFAMTVVNSLVFDKWIKNKTGKEYFWDAIDSYKERIIASDQSITDASDSKLMREIIADFVGEMLFTDNGSGLVAFSAALDVKQRSIIVQYILDFISWLKSKFVKQTYIDFELSMLQDGYMNLLLKAISINQKQNDGKSNFSKNTIGSQRYTTKKNNETSLIYKSDELDQSNSQLHENTANGIENIGKDIEKSNADSANESAFSIGEQSLDNISFCFVRCTDAEIIEQAERLERDGKKQKEIEEEVGVRRNVFGEWVRYLNINKYKFFPNGDARTKLHQPNPHIRNSDGTITGKLRDFVLWKEYFEMFPEYEEFRVEIRPSSKVSDTAKIMQDEKGLYMFINQNYTVKLVDETKFEPSKTTLQPYNVYLKADILRELRRLVQMKEGHYQGYSFEYWKNMEENGKLPYSEYHKRNLTAEDMMLYFIDNYDANQSAQRQLVHYFVTYDRTKNFNPKKAAMYNTIINPEAVYLYHDDGELITLKEKQNIVLHGDSEYKAKIKLREDTKAEQERFEKQYVTEQKEKIIKSIMGWSSAIVRDIIALGNSTRMGKVFIRQDHNIRGGNSGFLEKGDSTQNKNADEIIENHLKQIENVNVTNTDCLNRELNYHIVQRMNGSLGINHIGQPISTYTLAKSIDDLLNMDKVGIWVGTPQMVKGKIEKLNKKYSYDKLKLIEGYSIFKNPLILDVEPYKVTIEGIALELYEKDIFSEEEYLSAVDKTFLYQKPTSRRKYFIRKLTERGFDSIIFKNKNLDAGSLSVILLDQNNFIPIAVNGRLIEDNGVKDVEFKPHEQERTVMDAKTNKNLLMLAVKRLKHIKNRVKKVADNRIRGGDTAFFENDPQRDIEVYEQNKQAQKKQTVSERENDVDVSKDNARFVNRISIDMTDAQRYEFLKNKSINVENYDSIKENSSVFKNSEVLNTMLMSADFSHIVMSLYYQFHRPIDLTGKVYYDFSNIDLNKSLYEQYKENEIDCQIVSCFSQVIKNAVGVKIYDSGSWENGNDENIKNVYILYSALNNEKLLTPIKIEIKEFLNEEALYVSVRKGSTKTYPTDHSSRSNKGRKNVTWSSSIKFTDFVNIINPNDKHILEHIPKEFWNDLQFKGYNDQPEQKLRELEEKTKNDYKKFVDSISNNYDKELSGYTTDGSVLNQKAIKFFDKSVFKNENGDMANFWIWESYSKTISGHIRDGTQFGTMNSAIIKFINHKNEVFSIDGEFVCYVLACESPIIVQMNEWDNSLLSLTLLKRGIITRQEYERICNIEDFYTSKYRGRAAKIIRKHMMQNGIDSIVYVKTNGQKTVTPFYEKDVILISRNGILSDDCDIFENTKYRVFDGVANGTIINKKSHTTRDYDRISHHLLTEPDATQKIVKLTEFTSYASDNVFTNFDEVSVGYSGNFERGEFNIYNALSTYKNLISSDHRNIKLANKYTDGSLVNPYVFKWLDGTLFKDEFGRPLTLFRYYRSYKYERKYDILQMRISTLTAAQDEYYEKVSNKSLKIGGAYVEFALNIKRPCFLTVALEDFTLNELLDALYLSGIITDHVYEQLKECDDKKAMKYLKIALRNQKIDSIVYMNGKYDPGSMGIIPMTAKQFIPISKNGIAIEYNEELLSDSDESDFLLEENNDHDQEKIIDEDDFVLISDATENNVEKRQDKLLDNPRKKEYNKVEKIKCRNEHLIDENHPVTNVSFVKKQIKIDQRIIEIVVPKFDSLFDVQLPVDIYTASYARQRRECNNQLKKSLENNAELKNLFTEKQIKQIMEGTTPDDYTWHHDAEVGKMQLVEARIHAKTGHTGGRYFWCGSIIKKIRRKI